MGSLILLRPNALRAHAPTRDHLEHWSLIAPPAASSPTPPPPPQPPSSPPFAPECCFREVSSPPAHIQASHSASAPSTTAAPAAAPLQPPVSPRSSPPLFPAAFPLLLWKHHLLLLLLHRVRCHQNIYELPLLLLSWANIEMPLYACTLLL